TSPSSRHEVSSGCLSSLPSSVPGIAGHRLPLPRPNDCSYHSGRTCLGKKKINFSTVFAGQAVGIKDVQDDIWLVSFMDYDLGTLIWRLECSNRSKIRSVQKCYPCSRLRCVTYVPRLDLLSYGGGAGILPSCGCYEAVGRRWYAYCFQRFMGFKEIVKTGAGS